MRVKLDDRKFRMLLYDRGITQKALAERCGLSRLTVGKALSGATCSEETGRKICEALDVDIHKYAEFNKF